MKTAENNLLQNKLADWCHVIQSRMAAYLHVKADKLSGGTKKACLFIFCLAASACCIYTITAGLHIRSPVHATIGTIQFPTLLRPHEIKQRAAGQVISKQHYQNIELFKQYMDSLSQTAAGSIIYDSIIAVRPGLMDSVSGIENTFPSKILKNK